ncbi:MAG: DUF3368 domain-containing protein [Anaerolineae bacterium]
MADAICNTSPLLYLYRIGAMEWLHRLFGSIWVPRAVVSELHEGQRQGYDVPNLAQYSWLNIVDSRSPPSEWLSLDLGPGELAALSLALENPTHVLLLDDALARRTAQAAGLTVMGTLGILLQAKSQGLTDSIAPSLDRLQDVGMWISSEVRVRILVLADELTP